MYPAETRLGIQLKHDCTYTDKPWLSVQCKPDPGSGWMNLQLSLTRCLKDQVSPSCRRHVDPRPPPAFRISVFLQRIRWINKQTVTKRTHRVLNTEPSSLQRYDRTKEASSHFAWMSQNFCWTSPRLKSSLKSVSLIKDESAKNFDSDFKGLQSETHPPITTMCSWMLKCLTASCRQPTAPRRSWK